MTNFDRTPDVRWGADLNPAPSGSSAASDEDDADARVEQLAAEIDETRDDLTATIAEIGDKLDPGNLARDAGETVKAATLGKVEQMTYGAQETWRDVRTGNTGSLVDTITRNPIPAGMVALGIGMLFMNRGRSAQQQARFDGGRGFDADRESYGRGGASWESMTSGGHRSGGGSPMDKVGSTVSQAGDRVSEVADQAGQKVSGALESVGQTAEQIPHQAGYYLGRGGSQVRHFIDENPLGAGVIALAAGAAIGMLLPTTPLERDTIGPARDSFVDKAEGVAHEALDKVEQQVDRAASEA